ncbi:GlxA family transcriptional regulator [Noviherbaspirillum denitrificans]|uniref:AraC family transcriptional regulator n=1 Tax=Noviherbaspirillum denitrificans TaxID=1968433 RepID=A0A254TEN9_9BURK|nr:DJ-1/PfpI family protein [Noviherbaspirillum denitrificans]OWW21100.1 AraC family transcriptional regulator [Noviherbaspirillum denitrificans]
MSRPATKQRKAGPRRTVAFVTFPSVQLLDFAGPIDVFSLANRLSPEPPFNIAVLSACGGPVRTSSGLEIASASIEDIQPSSLDTLILAGGPDEGLRALVHDPSLKKWTQQAAKVARRYGSVCSGALALAEWGLLDGCRATTHWLAAGYMANRFPAVDVDPEALYVRDGRVWTSGGVTAGIDMCLAMIEEDLGRLMAASIAKHLILSTRRLGNQSQFSLILDSQVGRYAELVDWMRTHLNEPLDVQRLSAVANESVRNFHRNFRDETGFTPARFIEELRLQVARNKLEAGASVKASARAAGFTSDEHLARVFRRRFDMTPSQYGLLHSG